MNPIDICKRRPTAEKQRVGGRRPASSFIAATQSTSRVRRQGHLQFPVSERRQQLKLGRDGAR
eukprot:2681403-Pyramimonas_sp.AAC.1